MILSLQTFGPAVDILYMAAFMLDNSPCSHDSRSEHMLQGDILVGMPASEEATSGAVYAVREAQVSCQTRLQHKHLVADMWTSRMRNWL